ncbi:MAG: NAD(P)/FAD-dependent oxidoreductase [Christensenellales bacterium]|jgi:thioredoxin reductase
MERVDVLIIGAGPAGLSAAVAAADAGAEVLILERESRPGGILKQCIHDGFGLLRFGERLSGCEYAERYIAEAGKRQNIKIRLQTFVCDIKRVLEGFLISATSAEGMINILSKAIVLATGCRERTAKQVNIQGSRPQGVMTAGAAQHYVNILGGLPFEKCVILGSGDIGLIMARRLTLEGAKVLGVYEVKPTPSGLTRNIHQCLLDYDIPLYLSHTVTRVFGEPKLHSVEVAQVDENLQPIKGTERIIECDGLMLSVGLIPENEIAEKLGVRIDPRTKGAVVDEDMMTGVPGVFSAGNALHVHDLVDYVSECAAIAGAAAAAFDKQNEKHTDLQTEGFLYLVPQRIKQGNAKKVPLYFRAKEDMAKAEFTLTLNGETILKKRLNNLKPPEMVKLEAQIPVLGQSDVLFAKLEKTE